MLIEGTKYTAGNALPNSGAKTRYREAAEAICVLEEKSF